MTDDAARETAMDGTGDGHPGSYQPPTIERLGTLEELTLGGVVGPDDGLGGAGDAS
jgi:hypothetical protein